MFFFDSDLLAWMSQFKLTFLLSHHFVAPPPTSTSVGNFDFKANKRQKCLLIFQFCESQANTHTFFHLNSVPLKLRKGAKQWTSFFRHLFVAACWTVFPVRHSKPCFGLIRHELLLCGGGGDNGTNADIVNYTESGKSKRRRVVGGETWMHNVRPCWWLMGKWLMTWDWKNFLYQNQSILISSHHPISAPSVHESIG